MSSTVWKLGHEVWSQTDAGFTLVSRDGRAPGQWSKQQLAALLGFRGRSNSCSETAGCSEAFPSAFEYCPSCGGKLAMPLARESQLWLPPYGNLPSSPVRPSGLRLTEACLTLEQTDPRTRPHTELPSPHGAMLRFLVAPLGEHTPSLIAIDIANGSLYALASSKNWISVEPSGEARFSECSLPVYGWQVVAEDLVACNRLWLPTDHGLCAVRLDLATLTYEAEYQTAPCVGAPVLCAGFLAVPCAHDAGSLEVAFKPLGSGSAVWQSVTVALEGAGACRFESAISSSRRAIWESHQGQLLVSLSPSGKLGAEFVPWPQGCDPWFALGSPYVDKQGQFWRQCRRADGRILYVRLGKNPEIWDADGPRFSSGGLSFRQGTVILERDKPWEDVQSEADTAAKIIVPLLEHDSEDVVVCAEVDWAAGVGPLLNAPGKVQGRFALRGKVNRNFLNFDMRHPWDAVVFVWNGHLFLSHPEFDSIPGWRLA